MFIPACRLLPLHVPYKPLTARLPQQRATWHCYTRVGMMERFKKLSAFEISHVGSIVWWLLRYGCTGRLVLHYCTCRLQTGVGSPILQHSRIIQLLRSYAHGVHRIYGHTLLHGLVKLLIRIRNRREVGERR